MKLKVLRKYVRRYLYNLAWEIFLCDDREIGDLELKKKV